MLNAAATSLAFFLIWNAPAFASTDRCSEIAAAISEARTGLLGTPEWKLWHESFSCEQWRRFKTENDAAGCYGRVDCPHPPWDVYRMESACFEQATSCGYYHTEAFVKFREVTRSSLAADCPVIYGLSAWEYDYWTHHAGFYDTLPCSEADARSDEARRQWFQSREYANWEAQLDCQDTGALSDELERMGCTFFDGGQCALLRNRMNWLGEFCDDSLAGCTARSTSWYWEMWAAGYAPPCDR